MHLTRLEDRVIGQPHERSLQRWRELVERGDVLGLHRVITGLHRDSIEMREGVAAGRAAPTSVRRSRRLRGEVDAGSGIRERCCRPLGGR